ncbi:MAG TPA: DUF5394 family protein [Candidatus Megaira endosymbiont of Nemacystus decipiens]|nr:DUF5394 family protein [Candidatus Megaera endosymbiont of Nemacystus decipiens]
MKKIIDELTSVLITLNKSKETQDTLTQTIDRIFAQSNDIDYLKKELLKEINNHAKKAQERIKETNKTTDNKKVTPPEEELSENIENFIDDMIEMQGLSKVKQFNVSNINSKKNLKKLIKNFAIYEIYKIMNPKRIAGETKKMNYINNLVYGGKKLAQRYEGGKASDLKKYGEK